jgi:hypothetical protein
VDLVNNDLADDPIGQSLRLAKDPAVDQKIEDSWVPSICANTLSRRAEYIPLGFSFYLFT